MNPRVRSSLLATLAVTVPLMACARAPEATGAPEPQARSAAATTAAPAAPLVAGLPDFTGLVEQVGPAVVNIEAKMGARGSNRYHGTAPDPGQVPEIFRRLFPDMPDMPGAPGPGGPGGGGDASICVAAR